MAASIRWGIAISRGTGRGRGWGPLTSHCLPFNIEFCNGGAFAVTTLLLSCGPSFDHIAKRIFRRRARGGPKAEQAHIEDGRRLSIRLDATRTTDGRPTTQILPLLFVLVLPLGFTPPYFILLHKHTFYAVTSGTCRGQSTSPLLSQKQHDG